MFRWLRNWWWQRQRNIDLNVLWPVCKEQAPDLERARAAFAAYAFQDPAWISYYGRDRLIKFIDHLE